MNMGCLHEFSTMQSAQKALYTQSVNSVVELTFSLSLSTSSFTVALLAQASILLESLRWSCLTGALFQLKQFNNFFHPLFHIRLLPLHLL